MKCPRCKKQLRKGAKFCPACGARVEKKRGIRFTSILLVIVLLLSIVAIGWSGGILFAKYFSGNFKDLFSRKENVEIHNVEEAIAHAQGLGEELGYENAMSELTEKITTTIDGDTYYRLQQNYRGIPVYGQAIVYAANQNGIITSVSGNLSDIEPNLNVTPNINFEQAIDAVNAYFEMHHGVEDFCQYTSSDIPEGDIYICNTKEQTLLVYSVETGMYEVLVDAHTGNIVSLRQALNASSANNQQTFSAANYGWKTEKGTYVLRDTQRNIYIYDAKGKTYWDIYKSKINPKVLELVTSKDDLFGNKDDSSQTIPTAISFMERLHTAYDFFNDSFDEKGCGVIVGIYDDLQGDYNGANAGGGRMSVKDVLKTIPPDYDTNKFNNQVDAVIIGSSFSDELGDERSIIDTIGHEYTHCISDKYVAWCHSSIINFKKMTLAETNCENGAVREALSDIFGELIEYSTLKAAGGIMDWAHGDRTIYNPSENGYPQSATHEVVRNERGWLVLEEKATDYSHGFSTVISHAAYLMWRGGDSSDSNKRISEDELATLWYRAMLMMPSDCNFVDCRTLVELAASNMQLEDAQKQCVSESFDAVGIPRASEEEYLQLIHLLATDGETALKGTVYEKKSVDGVDTIVPAAKATLTVYSGDSKEDYKKVNLKNDDGKFDINLPAGTYSVAITADGYIGQTISFELADNEVRYFSVELEPADNKTGNNTDAYSAYLNAAQKITKSGGWSERLTMTADMAITDGSAKTKTKVTLTSDADVSNYSESDPSQIRMSGSAEMTVMGQTYAWDMEYENGTAHYRYTKPNHTSADMKIDPSFFNFGTMTSDMMTNAKLSGNKITFTVPGDKITEVGIAAVNQMSGVDNLKYGDVDVTVTISNEGKIDNIVMVFHASLEYQGYDADVDYNIDYRFADSTEKSDKPDSGDTGNLHEYLDLTKAWGIRKDVSTDPNFYMEQVYDFAFMEDGTFYCFFYQQYTDFLYGFHGTYLFESNQIKFYFDNDDGTSTEYAYYFAPDEMKLTQVTEKGIWNNPIGSEYDLVNDEWFPSAQDVINSAKRAFENRGVEMGG